jgi:RimJ/RimL family protein N-acetyltransferase
VPKSVTRWRTRPWGKGYINEALVALLEFGFTQLDLNRVEADIDPRNVASARTLERLGFQREGLLRQRWIVGDEVSDTAIYGLLAHEWRAKRG